MTVDVPATRDSMDVLERIEQVIAATVEVIATGTLPVLRFPVPRSRARYVGLNNAVGEGLVNRDVSIAGCSAEFLDGPWTDCADAATLDECEERSMDTTLNNADCLRRQEIPRQMLERDLLSRNANGAYHVAGSASRSDANVTSTVGSYTLVFKVLDVVHELLSASRRCTQRELYYRLQEPPVFSSMSDVTDAIYDVCCMLEVPRSALNICCSPKGAVAGRVFIRSPCSELWTDGRQVGLAGWSIPGDATEIEGLQFHCQAHYVLIIEKDAIFQRLTEDRFFDVVPSVLVTGKGMPDFATRLFLRRLICAFPHLCVLALVDWNPSGVAILNVYRHGSVRTDPHAQTVSLPELEWMGLRAHMLPPELHQGCHALTSRDLSLIHSLTSQLLHLPEWIQELQLMQEHHCKCDIEAIYQICGISGFTAILAESIQTRPILSISNNES